MKNLTTTEIEHIVLDAALLYLNYGETDQKLLGITKGGVEFNVTENVRDIEYDGRRGATKGMQVVDEVNAYLKATTLEADPAIMKYALAAATLNTAGTELTHNGAGVVSTASYLSNVTAFGTYLKTGTYMKIELANAFAEGGLTLGTTDKGEGTYDLQFNAHWDPTNQSTPIYTITTTTSITTA